MELERHSWQGGCDACQLRLKGFAGDRLQDPASYRAEAGRPIQ
ncbi:MAG: hypothetical protein O7A08_03200 [SAR324 cluster bacterium]|nr:hypothetical protein [SAR324 cluster bacterium]MCZ6728183.1 hypothetical protein [SAR324 cluster bacterium]MCZ6843921.1 hypothetical protein [SAR324 cluster bacterium]